MSQPEKHDPHQYRQYKSETLRDPVQSPYQSPRTFARVTGVLDWCCPHCNALHKTPIKARYKALHCSLCDSHWEYGLTFYQSPSGRHLIPMDTLMIAGGFASRRLVNKALCSDCAKALKREE